MNLDERVINQIVETVVQKLTEQGGEISDTPDVSRAEPDIKDGVFQGIEDALRAAEIAQKGSSPN